MAKKKEIAQEVADQRIGEVATDMIVRSKVAAALTTDDVRKYFDPQNKCSDVEIGMFIKICQAQNLNPFIREAYLIKYAGSPAQIITGYEVYLKRAEKSGLWGGEKVWTEGDGANVKCCIEIYRKDWQKPLYHEVYLREYAVSANPLWRSKPLTMIKKVARAQAYRLAFPENLGGLPYTSDEFSPGPEVEPSKPAGKPIVTEPEELNQPEPVSGTLPGTLPDFDKIIKTIMLDKHVSAASMRDILSVKFKRKITKMSDLTMIEKEATVKLLQEGK